MQTIDDSKPARQRPCEHLRPLLRLHAHIKAIKCFSSYQRIRLWDETTVRDCLPENIGLDSSRKAVIEGHVGPKTPLFVPCENGETSMTGEAEPTWVRTSAMDFFVESRSNRVIPSSDFISFHCSYNVRNPARVLLVKTLACASSSTILAVMLTGNNHDRYSCCCGKLNYTRADAGIATIDENSLCGELWSN